jgi:hypothetical protein
MTEILKPHPASMLFPMLLEPELEELAADIKLNGLLEPIDLYAGMIIDGRNRYQACARAAVEPRFNEIEENRVSAIQYVVSKNIHRRHLTTSQRAAIAAEMMPMLREEARKRQSTRGTEVYRSKHLVALTPQGESPNGINKVSQKSRDIAARAVEVGGKIVQEAVRVKNAAPEEFEKIKRGEITVGEATRQLAGKPLSKRQVILEKATYEKMVRCNSSIGPAIEVLCSLNISFCLANLTVEQRLQWIDGFELQAKKLKDFTLRLKRSSI